MIIPDIININELELSGFTLNVINNYIYINGGFCNMEAQNKMYKLDFNFNIIKTYTDDHYIPRTSHSSCYNEKTNELYFIYGSGSVFGLSNINDIAIFNIDKEEYTHFIKTDYINGRYGQSSILYENNTKILIFGGTYGIVFTNGILIYDLVNKRYELPIYINIVHRYKHIMMKLTDDLAIIYGGYCPGIMYDESTYLFDLKTLKYKTFETHLILTDDRNLNPPDSIMYNDSMFIYDNDKLIILERNDNDNNNESLIRGSSIRNKDIIKKFVIKIQPTGYKFERMFIKYDVLNLQLNLYILLGRQGFFVYNKTISKYIIKTYNETFKFINKYVFPKNNDSMIIKNVMSFIY